MTRYIVAAAMLAAVSLTAILAPSAPAHAQSTLDRNAAQTACRTDYQRFCAATQPGGGRIRQCLLARESELSGACRDVLKRTAATR